MPASDRFGLSLDWETSGYSLPDFASRHQGIAFGAVVVDLYNNFEPVDTLKAYIKFDPIKYGWDDGAQKIHGITQQYLKEHGVEPQDAAVQLGNLIVKYWGDFSNPVIWMGQHVDFDIAFTRQLMNPFGIMFNISHLYIETASLGFVNLGVWKSNDIYTEIGLEPRGRHDPLEDALYTVETCKRMRSIFQYALNNM